MAATGATGPFENSGPRQVVVGACARMYGFTTRGGGGALPSIQPLTHGYCAPVLRMTRRPSLRSESSYGPCGPAWTGASRPSTTSHRTRDEQSARGLDVRGHGAQQRPRTRVFWLGRHRTGAIPTYTCPRRLEFRATGSLCERRVKALCAFSASLRPFGRLAARAGSELIMAGRNRPASEYTEPLRRRLRKVRQGVMANRSDRDPLNLKGPRGTKPVKRMRCGSADSIGAGRRKSCTNRPDIEPQPVRQTRQNRPLPKRETSI